MDSGGGGGGVGWAFWDLGWCKIRMAGWGGGEEEGRDFRLDPLQHTPKNPLGSKKKAGCCWFAFPTVCPISLWCCSPSGRMTD